MHFCIGEGALLELGSRGRPRYPPAGIEGACLELAVEERSLAKVCPAKTATLKHRFTGARSQEFRLVKSTATKAPQEDYAPQIRFPEVAVEELARYGPIAFESAETATHKSHSTTNLSSRADCTEGEVDADHVQSTQNRGDLDSSVVLQS